MVNANNPRPMYFSQIRVDPNNPDHTILGGVRMTISLDGGKTQLAADPSAHDDKHALWWDPNNSNHILIGTDGGVYASWDMTRTWIWYPNLPVGLFYHVGYDNETPFNVCGGMQDNYDWCGPSAVRTRVGIANDRWQTVQGGDGFVAIPDLRDGRIVYSESQDGNTTRHNRVTGESKSIRPSAQNVVNAQVGAMGCDPPVPGGGGGGRGGGGGPCAPYRFNWDTPMLFSPTDPGVLYIAGNHVFRSTDRGDSWTAVSPDLTSNANREDIVTMGLKGSDVRISKNDGIVAWPTIVSFSESAKQPGLYYAGTDDGTVSVSKDAGKTWDKTLADRMPGFVKGAWVSKVMPSRFDAATVYVASDAHRLNDYETHIWVSHDFGATFQSLNGNLKGEARQDADGRSAQPGRDLRGHGDRALRLARSRQELVAAAGQFPGRARRRDHAASARERDAACDARPVAVDPRSHLADSGVHGGAGRGRASVLDRSGAAVAVVRRQERRVLGASVLRRRESADRRGDSVLPEERGERSEAEDHRLARQGRAHAHDGAGAARGRDSNRVLGHAR